MPMVISYLPEKVLISALPYRNNLRRPSRIGSERRLHPYAMPVLRQGAGAAEKVAGRRRVLLRRPQAELPGGVRPDSPQPPAPSPKKSAQPRRCRASTAASRASPAPVAELAEKPSRAPQAQPSEPQLTPSETATFLLEKPGAAGSPEDEPYVESWVESLQVPAIPEWSPDRESSAFSIAELVPLKPPTRSSDADLAVPTATVIDKGLPPEDKLPTMPPGPTVTILPSNPLPLGRLSTVDVPPKTLRIPGTTHEIRAAEFPHRSCVRQLATLLFFRHAGGISCVRYRHPHACVEREEKIRSAGRSAFLGATCHPSHLGAIVRSAFPGADSDRSYLGGNRGARTRGSSEWLSGHPRVPG